MSTITTTIKINDAFSGALNKLSSGLEKSQSGFDHLKTKLSSGTSSSNGFFKSMLGANVVGGIVTNAMGAAGNGIRSMIDELNEASTSWQTFDGNMRQLGKSPAQIASAKKSMQQFAQQTIYSASDMASTYAQLAAVGTKNTTQLVKGFGGLAAASNNPKQAMKTLSEQATQMAAKPKVQWQDFKLMLEQTPAGIAAVAKSMGKSTQQLIKDVQDGKVKTQDLFDAIAKTGNNANFSKMATQFKTVGQAVDGLKETLANSLQPAFDKISQYGIKAVSKLTDSLGNINFSGMADGLIKVINSYIVPAVKTAKQAIQDLFSGFKESGALSSIKGMFSKIGEAVKSLGDSFGKISGKGKNGLFSQLGKISGGAISGIAKAIGSMATAIGKIDPSTLQVLGVAFAVLKTGTKGLVLGAVVAGLNALNKLDPGTLNALATAITALAVAFAMWKAATSIAKGISGVADAFGKLKKLKMPKLKTPEIEEPKMQKSSNIAKNASAYMKLGAALMFVGAGVALAGVGFKQMADAASKLASAGGAAIAVFFGMIAAIALLAVLVKTLGAGMIGGAIGFAILGAALILVGAGLTIITNAAIKLASAGGGAIAVLLGIGIAIALLAVLVSALGPALVVGAIGFFILGAGILLVVLAVAIAAVGLTLLATQLPTIAQYGLMAALAIIALAVAIAIFGIGAVVAAIGIIALAVALVALAIGLAIAGVGAIVFAVGLTLVAVAALVAAVGILLLGVGLALVAVFVLIAAVGMIMLGVGIMLVGVFALVAAVGLMLMGVGLMLLMVFAMVAAVGIMMLGVSLMLIMVFAMIAAVGIMMLDVAVMVLAVGLMVVAAALMMVSSALMMVGVGAMAMVSMFIAAGQMMVSAIRGAMNNVVSSVRSGISRAVSAARNMAGQMVSAGADLIKGLINGIKSMVGAAVSAAQSVASKVVGAVKGALHIGSPSRLMKQYGRWFDQGLIIGLNHDANKAANAAGSMAQGVVDAATTMNPTMGMDFAVSSPGDELATGFQRALGAVNNVADAITNIDGSQANIGIVGQGASLTGNTGIGTSSLNAESITPSSYHSSVVNGGNSNSTNVNIDKGAIQINSTGDVQYDADTLLRRLEQSIMAQRNKSLGGA
ncbi:tape measure protein [Lactobacillus sp. PV034]|uniref:tape measure protein n=1 Tax=Lactobacillus sp. PV034 TaxID=2594495 RepID=UPI00223EBE1A|nr:tape measure protein [Lactobacillus sp. PV034]QNQ80779.1 tape measure protein [Lactobacillus sp. PV034]